MKVMNWESIEEAASGEKLPAGGYVVRITNVEDVPSKEYLWVEYDIAEGEHAGHYSDEYAKSHPYIHRFSRSYKETAAGFFKAFLMRLEEGNRGRFSVAEWQKGSNENELVGLELGIVVQNEKYTNEKGDDKERLQVVGIYAPQDIRNGDFKVPPVTDKRERVQDAGGAYDESVPF